MSAPTASAESRPEVAAPRLAAPELNSLVHSTERDINVCLRSRQDNIVSYVSGADAGRIARSPHKNGLICVKRPAPRLASILLNGT